MGRCENCGKRDQTAAQHCADCRRPHRRDECSSRVFNDPLRWCWCGSPRHSAPATFAITARWLQHYRDTT